MADLTLPEVITRFRGNEARIADFANGNAAGYYTTADGKKVETLPSVVSRLAAAIAAASATAETLKGIGGAKLIGFGTVTVDAALTTQAKGIADNAKAITDLDAAKLAKSGGTMTGALKLAADPTDPFHAATKGWAEGLIGSYWKPVIGDSLTTARGAPNANWIPDGANYLQTSYPELFAKIGLVQSDAVGIGTWTQVNTTLITGANGYVQPFLAAAGSVVISYLGGSTPAILRSADSGTTFTSITPPTSANLIALSTDGKGTWIAGAGQSSPGMIVRSTDNGLTWQTGALPTGTNSWSTLFTATDSKGTWLIGGNYAFLQRSTDNGATWTQIAAPDGASMRWAAHAGGSTWYGVSSTYLYRSTDGGVNWTKLSAPTASATVSIQGLSFSNGIIAVTGSFAIGSNPYVSVSLSTDGVNWRTASLSVSSNANASPVCFGRDGSALVVFYTNGAYRLSPALDPTHVSGVANFTLTNFGQPTTWPVAIINDGLSTWYMASSNSGGIVRLLPLYDVKTLFRVPKLAIQPAPFATFVKAK